MKAPLRSALLTPLALICSFSSLSIPTPLYPLRLTSCEPVREPVYSYSMTCEEYEVADEEPSPSNPCPFRSPSLPSPREVVIFAGSATLGAVAGVIAGSHSCFKGDPGQPGRQGEPGIQGQPGMRGERGLPGPVVENSLIFRFQANDKLEGWEGIGKKKSRVTWSARVKPPLGDWKELPSLLTSGEGSGGSTGDSSILFEKNSLLGNYVIEIEVKDYYWNLHEDKKVSLGTILVETDPLTNYRKEESIGSWNPNSSRQWQILVERDENP